MGIHDAPAVPAASAQLLDTGDSLPAQPPATVPASRLRLRMAPTTGPAAPVGQAAERDRHLSPGTPDPRRTGGPHGDPAAGAPDAGDYVNRRTPADVHHTPGPTRNRAGSTSADPARPAKMPHAFTIRPFDKWRNPTPGAVPKIEQPAPSAASAPMVRHPRGTRPNPAGNTPDTARGVVAAHRNTFRLIPTPWDEQLITTGNPAAAAPPNRRATGWRAR